MSAQFNPYSHLGITINPDGTVTRQVQFPSVDPNPEPVVGNPTVCKDITLNPKHRTYVRLYRPVKLPSNDNTVVRLPVMIFFHGGGFVLYTASDSFSHHSCIQVASDIPAIIVSVNYRLAPEHKLPACYEDAVDAILWVKQQALDPEGEPWLRSFGDFTRCYLSGRGNGANIAYHAALRTLGSDLGPVKIAGLIYNQPMFGGVQRTKSEINFAADHVLPLPALDTLWDLALPGGADRDHRFSNPMADGPHKNNLGSLPRSLVIGFNGDPLIDRQQQFVQMLALAGVQVEAEFDEVGFHGVK
ncbi:hypothetical protein JRO89_XS01G0303500 [Xanthoceras sorbifolium]|uniref:Alpha/beta hydrolase fold-3 domain-containing protein n=1 Tax=Xanthoceras sorbifolium TaxID=99658 RepID=A0ABQ8IM89_9ROSI|nr:hypothetical protein JRO89_XS01G0303500 [Xanthoceras sorbifolium]